MLAGNCSQHATVQVEFYAYGVKKTFRLERKHIGCNFIYLEGIWVADGAKVNIINI